MNTSNLIERIDLAIELAAECGTSADYTGPDPYDGLLSPVARLLHRPRLRQALTQLVKRSPIDLRAVLGIPPVRMAKTQANFAWSHARLAQHRAGSAESATALLADLLACELPGGGWGYEFDVQTRWHFYPALSPNIVVTAFAIEAFTAHDMLESVSARTIDWLTTAIQSGHGSFRYVPSSDVLIHNANLLGARALARLDPTAASISDAIDATTRHQLPNGLWWYGEEPKLRWIDGFHTAYVLDCLRDLDRLGFDVGDHLETAMPAWVDSFWTSDVPAHFIDRRGRPDTHNTATCVGTLAWVVMRLGILPARLVGPVEKLLALQDIDGGFRSPGEPTTYMRWGTSHALRALVSVREVLNTCA